MPDNSRSNITKRLVRVSPGLRALCVALAVALLTTFACGSSEKSASEPVPPGGSNLDLRFDLSGMNADETQAEIIRLLNDGHVMYTRQEVFAPGGPNSTIRLPVK